MQLNWLPLREDWDAQLRAAKILPPTDQAARLGELAGSRMEFSQVVRLDRTVQRLLACSDGELPGFERVRLAILGSATTAQLVPGIRVAGLRRRLNIEIYETPYGMYPQELVDTASGLHQFRPEVVLFAFDARHLAGLQCARTALETMQCCWRQAKENFACQVLQQTAMPVFPNLMGNNEERLPHSPAAILSCINESLRPAAAEAGVELLALDRLVASDGLAAWYDPGMWHHSKQEVHPTAAEMYGEQVARLVAAARGRSAKCLVLDLDNTLWGGVIGDDGLNGIVLGQGSGQGEAFVEFQQYAKGLSLRGVILAVCSKNDHANAVEPFESHPEMVLRSQDVVCFMANWEDKATNLRSIAKQLNIGLDALVFVDDNPVERGFVRRELPMVAVPELPEDPAGYAAALAAAGYFEGLRTTDEDRARCKLYQANVEREQLRETVTDINSYLESLNMTLTAKPFDGMGVARVTQLINKTNQFNLMTQRLTEVEVAARMNDPHYVTLQVRLTDRFGDNGIIAVLMARLCPSGEAMIETWLMSCRVLGRKVEEACLNVLAETCAAHGMKRLVGGYRPTDKNSMVRELYGSLGFKQVETDEAGVAHWLLSLEGFQPKSVPIQVEWLQETLV
ncbi:HAD-IIIC family phosphatase [Granulicella mallensis]|uniref:FkbH-like protein n=1 Tax=Granulicella mallensis TaxID=940614 RepID=A0A7W8EA93_9BACT|nr:HAD-IIIC family phosphatase [Granulicella mallensis]MBB5063185.1 FkbH-like protein [Granulicella mallensis]